MTYKPQDNRVNEQIIREALDYNPETGELTWRVRPPSHFLTKKLFKIWNKRYSGKKAGSFRKDGYLQVKLNRKPYLNHRISWFLYYGCFPNNQIDHANGVKTDNRIQNLRDVTHQQNAMNRKKEIRNNSGVTGVRFSKRLKKWRSEIKCKSKYYYIGVFENFDDAVAARKEAEQKYGFHKNHGRKS